MTDAIIMGLVCLYIYAQISWFFAERRLAHWRAKYFEAMDARIEDSIKRQTELKHFLDQYADKMLTLEKNEILTKIDGRGWLKK